jgi:hypothetical protein
MHLGGQKEESRDKQRCLSNSLTYPRVFQNSKFDDLIDLERETNRTDVELRYLVIPS